MHELSTGAGAGAGSLGELVELRARQGGDDLLYRFLADDGTEVCWSCADFERAVGRVSAALQGLGVAGEPVLLLYPTGLEYIAAFFGCLAVGAIAVPAYPPRPGRALQRLETIVDDCRPRVALTTGAIVAALDRDAKAGASLRALSLVATDALPEAGGWSDRPRGARANGVAFLQYTSGSTGDPKGVVVTHGNLLHNLSTIFDAFNHGGQTATVSWLPIYHDMGLIGGVLGPLYAGGSLTLLSPKRFQENPLAWLEAISRYGATHAGGPTFAYDWCLRRTAAAEREKLDLSRWQVAFCGAEPIRRETLEAFCRAFAPAGFHPNALTPCYGLAEATLMVTSRIDSEPLLMPRFSKQALAGGHLAAEEAAVEEATNDDAISLVGCGAAVGGQRVVIVDPETCRPNPAGRIGEIWVQGPSVAGGYWKREALTADVFDARLADSGEGPFLRSGDLGCFYQGQLFVTGRIKDLIIVRGRNHYPQDIELAAQASHADLQTGGGAAFGLSGDEAEQVVLVHEVRREAIRGLDAQAVIRAICQAVAREHELRLDAVGLVRPGSIGRTTSGKIERHSASRRFAAGDFEFIELWKSPVGDGSPPADEDQLPAQAAAEPLGRAPAGGEAPLDWLADWLARRLNLERERIDPGQPLAVYGLDSLMAVELMHDVERAFGRSLDVGTLVDSPNLAFLADWLTDRDAGPPDLTTEVALVPPGVVRPRWRGPFGDRADGILVRGESPMREIMPYLMRSRGESLVYLEAQYDLARTLPWLEAYNRRHPDARATLFDLFLWAAAYVAHTRPGMNRFICGRRIYQRREVAISFAVKKRYDLTAELMAVKLRFPERAMPFSQCVQRIAAGVDEACQGPPRPVDRETALLMRLPRFVLRTALWGYRILDHCNLLPGKVFANDPLYATLFVTNLGSLGLDSAFHHLYEHGTCSLFAALGVPKKMPATAAHGTSQMRQLWPVRWTLDERIVDGFYSAACLRMLKSILENPAEFVPAEPRDPGV